MVAKEVDSDTVVVDEEALEEAAHAESVEEAPPALVVESFMEVVAHVAELAAEAFVEAALVEEVSALVAPVAELAGEVVEEVEAHPVVHPTPHHRANQVRARTATSTRGFN